MLLQILLMSIVLILCKTLSLGMLVLLCLLLVAMIMIGVILFIIFGVTEVFESYSLLQTIMFLIDSVFYVLFAYFDDTMGSIGGYEPWKSWNIVDITQI